MFVIKTGENYWHKDGQIILYQNPDEAKMHIQGFMEYAMNRIMQEAGPNIDPFELMNIQPTIMMNSKIMPIDFDLQANPHVKTIWRYEIEN